MKHPLVTSDWLKTQLDQPNLVLLDVSQSETSEVPLQKIPGARRVDLKTTFCDPKGQFPSTFPSAAQFEDDCKRLGINNTSTIVVYDHKGIYLSPRVWWLFRAMGHENVFVLDGGFPDWLNHGNEIETKDTPFSEGNFKAHLQAEWVKNFAFVQDNISTQKHLLVDARSEGRFQGTAPEPRPEIRSGSIPNSINIPFTDLIENGKYKSIEALKERFDKSAIDERPLVFTCGSGITACIVLLASEMILENSTAVYDGSWTEWAQLI